MRLTTRTNLAMRALMYCAVNADGHVRKSDIAAACNASENHLAQVIRLLGAHGFIDAMRGRHGGLQLARDPGVISVGAVFRVFEADLPFAECFDGGENTCPLKACCWLRDALKQALAAFYQTLDAITLKDLVEGNAGLDQVLHAHGALGGGHRRQTCPAAVPA